MARELLARFVYGKDNDPAMVAMVLEWMSFMGLRLERGDMTKGLVLCDV